MACKIYVEEKLFKMHIYGELELDAVDLNANPIVIIHEIAGWF